MLEAKASEFTESTEIPILPERFTTISEPVNYPIVHPSLTSISELINLHRECSNQDF